MKEPERTDFIGMLAFYAVGIFGAVAYTAFWLGMIPPPETPPDETGRFLTFVVAHAGAGISLYCLGFAIWISVWLWRDRKRGRIVRSRAPQAKTS